ncbi:hypothetical protein AM593_00285, partial [Mytilus galloprovincialis]
LIRFRTLFGDADDNTYTAFGLDIKILKEQVEKIEPEVDQMKKTKYECMTCGKSYSQRQGLSRHIRTDHLGEKHVCKTCRETFNRRDNYLRHIKKQRCQQRRDSSTDIDENKS